MVAAVTDSTIDNFINGTDVSVVVFSAAWCGPCRMLAPVLDVLSNENDGVSIGKVDVQSEAQSTMKYGITSIPAIVFFKGGLVADRVNGATNKGVLQSKIDALK